MFQHLRGEVRAEGKLEEQCVELGLREARVTTSQTLAGHRSDKPGEVIHERQSPRGTHIAVGTFTGGRSGVVHGYRGEVDKAFEWLERSYFLRDSGIPLVRLSRQLESLHADPRWARLLARVGLKG